MSRSFLDCSTFPHCTYKGRNRRGIPFTQNDIYPTENTLAFTVYPWRKFRQGIESERIRAILKSVSESIRKTLSLVQCKSVKNQSNSFRFNPRLQSGIGMIRIIPKRVELIFNRFVLNEVQNVYQIASEWFSNRFWNPKLSMMDDSQNLHLTMQFQAKQKSHPAINESFEKNLIYSNDLIACSI